MNVCKRAGHLITFHVILLLLFYYHCYCYWHQCARHRVVCQKSLHCKRHNHFSSWMHSLIMLQHRWAWWQWVNEWCGKFITWNKGKRFPWDTHSKWMGDTYKRNTAKQVSHCVLSIRFAICNKIDIHTDKSTVYSIVVSVFESLALMQRSAKRSRHFHNKMIFLDFFFA